MKVTLEFELPEENEEMQTALDAGRWRTACIEFDNWLRARIKYHEHPLVDANEIRKKLHELLVENDLSW